MTKPFSLLHKHLLSSWPKEITNPFLPLSVGRTLQRAEHTLCIVTPHMTEIILWRVTLKPRVHRSCWPWTKPSLVVFTVPQHFQMTSLERFRLLYHPKALSWIKRKKILLKWISQWRNLLHQWQKKSIFWFYISNLVNDEWVSHTEPKGHEKSVSNILETNYMTEAGNVLKNTSKIIFQLQHSRDECCRSDYILYVTDSYLRSPV